MNAQLSDPTPDRPVDPAAERLALFAELRAGFETVIQLFDEVARMFATPKLPPGASWWTLCRRVSYGGRKGRRAFRRMLRAARAPLKGDDT